MWFGRLWGRKQPGSQEAAATRAPEPAVSPEARALFDRIVTLAEQMAAPHEPATQAADTGRYQRQHAEHMAIRAATKAADPAVLAEVARLALPAWMETIQELEELRRTRGYYSSSSPGLHLEGLLSDFVVTVLAKPMPWTREDVSALIRAYRRQEHGWSRLKIAKPLLRTVQRLGLLGDAEVRAWVQEAVAFEERQHRPDRKWTKLAQESIGETPGFQLAEGEAWSDALASDLEAMDEAQRAAWTALLTHASAAGGSAPSNKWSSEAARLAQTVGRADVVARLAAWFPRVDEGRERDIDLGPYAHFPAGSLVLTDAGQELLKGLCWCAAALDEPGLVRVLGRLALSAYRKVPGVGPRAVKVGNAAIHALGCTSGPEALGQLAMLRVKLKSRAADKVLEKALNAAAARAGLSLEDIEELAVPSYGFTQVGARREELAGFRVELAIDVSGTTTLRFQKADGRVQKTAPAAIRSAHAEELADLKAAAKDAAAMLSAQRERIDALYLEEKTWPFAVWRERYLDHPLTGVIARGLLWEVVDGGARTRTVFFDAPRGGFVDARGGPVEIVEEGATVRLWHPIGHPVDDVLAWRRFFEERGLRQPFKQAHREIYLLTDAERATGTYSNRFAAHVLRQHQFHALCAARRWRNKLRMLVDDDYPPASRTIARHDLRAEYWIEGAGTEYGQDTNESGAFLHLVTDQVRFYRTGAAENRAHAGGGGYAIARPGEGPESEPLPLDQVPALVLSEVMRDVDLFVGVASVGANPAWQDGGPGNRYRDYWWSYGFGDLSESGAGRRELLERLIPRLAIAAACSFTERFLVVRGTLRTYKIHLGSGNILMEPNDLYLCIVPDASQVTSSAGTVHLPFEGDRTLSVILSKAFLLAADHEITDPTILRQIRA